MPNFLNLLPNVELTGVAPTLQQYLRRAVQTLTPETFLQCCDPVFLDTLHAGLAQAGAHEGSIWLLDQNHQFLVNVYNNGPRADRLQGFQQPLSEGIISMVFATEQAFAENEVYRQVEHSKRVDTSLGVITYAMAAVPFYFASGCRGVISGVQLAQANKQDETGPPAPPLPAGFDINALSIMQRVAHALRAILEHQLVLAAFGLDHL